MSNFATLDSLKKKATGGGGAGGNKKQEYYAGGAQSGQGVLGPSSGNAAMDGTLSVSGATTLNGGLAMDVDKLSVHVSDVVIRFDYQGDPAESVDIESTTDAGGGFNDHTLNVQTSGIGLPRPASGVNLRPSSAKISRPMQSNRQSVQL